MKQMTSNLINLQQNDKDYGLNIALAHTKMD